MANAQWEELYAASPIGAYDPTVLNEPCGADPRNYSSLGEKSVTARRSDSPKLGQTPIRIHTPSINI
jgi:hypothetical protein